MHSRSSFDAFSQSQDLETNLESPVSVPVNGAGPSILDRMSRVETLAETLMASWLDGAVLLDHRRSHRVNHRVVFAITPFSECGTFPSGDSQLAKAWDISRTGISFTHQEPISCRMAVATFARPDGSVESILTRLKWCRFTKRGEYRSGGAFAKVLSMDFIPDLDLTLLTNPQSALESGSSDFFRDESFSLEAEQ